jgi:hypothetical protein
MSVIPKRKTMLTVPPFEELTLLIFGKPGSGKTSFCNGDPDTITIAAEPGSEFVETRDVLTRDWVTFQKAVLEVSGLIKKDPKDVSGVVIDIVDNLYDYCMDHVCKRLGIVHPTEKDFGKSWGDVSKEWKMWLTSLIDLCNIRFITHMAESDEEMVNEHGLKEEIKVVGPRFSGSKARFLDGVVRANGYMYTNMEGKHCITFKQTAYLGTKDRTGILAELGEVVLPTRKQDGFKHVADLYAAKAVELGFQVKSMKGR